MVSSSLKNAKPIRHSQIRRVPALAPRNAWVLADVAGTYDHLGDRKRAIQYAQDSLKNGYTLTNLQQRPALRGLLADPGFQPRGKR